MEDEELKYMLNLLDGLNEKIFEEILQLYYDTVEEKPFKGLSEDILQFLSINLKTNPVTSAAVLALFQKKLYNNDSLLKDVHNLYISALQDEMVETESKDRFVSLLSILQFNNDYIQDLVDKVLKHIPQEIFTQYKKQIYMSLIAQKHPKLLTLCTKLSQKFECPKNYSLTPEYMLELCYQDKVHWLLKAVQEYKEQIHDMKNVTFKINNFTMQIIVMVLVDIMNKQESYGLPSLVQELHNIFSLLNSYDPADKELQFYIMEVKRELTIIKFCLENNCKMSPTSLFSQILSQSALAVISQLCRLPNVDRYKVSRLLNANNDVLKDLISLAASSNTNVDRNQTFNWDVVTYNSYCAITNVIDIILNSPGDNESTELISSSLEEVNRLVVSLHPLELAIEIVENIFTCLFLRYEQFSCEDDFQDSPCGAHSDCSYFFSKKQSKSIKSLKNTSVGFICNAFTTQMILNTLKSCSEALEEKWIRLEKDSNVVGRLKNIVKMVNHALWKLQLVSTLSPETMSVPKLCCDYVEVAETSDDEDCDKEVRVHRRKSRVRRRHTNPKSDCEQVMVSSATSVNDEGSVAVNINNTEFISTMLAKPNCLVALALYHNDFTKANQIIEMFDLADAEIATEVQFTEQFRRLIGKLKNILYYKDDSRYPTKELSTLSVVSTEVMGLVEGFLSCNRSPNSLDIIELSTRHPHLQLYNYQNAPFINAVDILLSSGLNREITYGLINVVERKLAEVRANTDVAAVKKTNYIRFVEDIASVTFEILGNTEKAFDFVDNICGIINDSKVPIKHKEFCKLNQLSKDLKKCCKDLEDVVALKDCSIDINMIQKYHQTYMNVVAAADKDICSIGELCQTTNKKTRVHYLRMCYMYCKTVSQLEDNGEVTEPPYFSILVRRLHDIIGNLITKKKVPVTSLEPACKKLNINLIHKIILNFCPQIKLANPNKEAKEVIFNNLLQVVYNFKNTEENLFIDPLVNFAPLPDLDDQQSLTYLVLNNWVLAHIVKKIHAGSTENSLQQSIDARTKFLNNFMDLERFKVLKTLFGNNRYLASLHTVIDLDQLFTFMPKLIESGKILKCLDLIDALSEHQLYCSTNLMNLRDLILFKLSIHPQVESNWKYCQYLKCPQLKVDLILNNLSSWPTEGAMEVMGYLKCLLNQVSADEGLYDKCKDWLVRIPLYDQIASIMGESSWYTIYEKSFECTEEIVEVLMDSQQYKLCLEWTDVHNVTENMKNLIIVNLLRQLFEYTNQATPNMIRELLQRLPAHQAVDLVHEEKSKIRNVEILQVCIEYVTENSSDWKMFENVKIGLQIMLEIDVNLRSMFWDLIEQPLLMIEQFLMNAKLDVLTNIINKISSTLQIDPSGDNLYYNIKSIESTVISRNSLDALLRYYAEKALDMKNPSNSCTSPPKPSYESLLQSIDSINIEAASKPFVMPDQVPTKEQWVADYSTDRCMLCHTSIFSMIIRRHHCRRCGRLVCHACSRHRMQVPSYPSGVKFRVCDECYSQTMNKKVSSEQEPAMQSSNSDSGGSGVTCMDWCLSINANKNEAVRNEFSYEFTPNVTLCLSIMKMHSINVDYPRFLLDRSEEVSPEVSSGGDARLLIRARRSLLLAAAELYARTPPDNNNIGWARVVEAGAAHAARCLSHADAMSTLIKHAAHHLLPSHTAHHKVTHLCAISAATGLPPVLFNMENWQEVDTVSGHTARYKGREGHIIRSLLEAEKWDLALEIATKSGHPRNSVLAAWGKACLKAGRFKAAREKFAHCFKSSLQLNMYPEGVDDCEYGKEASEVPVVNRRLHSLRYSERSSSVSSMQSDGRPKGNPPLLNEIISILEDINYPVNQQLLNKAEAIKATNEKLSVMNTSKKRITLTEPALNIMHTLASVKKIKSGDYSDFQTAVVQPKKSMAQTLLRRNNNNEQTKSDNQLKKLDPFFHKECVYYLTNYGSHAANIYFHMKHSNLTEVLNYCFDNMVDRDTFTECVYMDCLRKDKINELIRCMGEMDSTFEMWSEYVTHICRTLEQAGRLEVLYEFQCGTGQHARASATCARLYGKPVSLSANLHAVLLSRHQHLAAATHHLSQTIPVASKSNNTKTFHLQLDKSTIDKHLTTIARQIELGKFLADCESKGTLTNIMIYDVMPGFEDDNKLKDIRPVTLFGSNTDRMRLATLTLVAGRDVSDGFNLGFKIITENRLDSMKVYMHVTRFLVQADRFLEVKTLAKCVRDSKETAASLMSDQILENGVKAVVSKCESRGQLHDEQAEILIEDIHSISVKISCYLECRILPSAYILAVRHERINDLRKILHEAERLGNEQIRSACLKRLTTKNT